MAYRANGRKGILLGVLALSVAAFLLVATPAKGGWLSKSGAAVGVGAAAGGALLLGNNLKKRYKEMFGILERSHDAFEKGDREKVDAAWEETKKIPGRLVVDQNPILKASAYANEMYQNTKRRIKRFLGGDDGIDHGLALVPLESESERELLGRKPIPKPRGIRFSRRTLPVGPGGSAGETAWGVQDAPRAKVPSKPAKRFSFNKWALEQRRARPHCYGVVSDETSAECDRELWSKKWKEPKARGAEASWGSDDRWGSEAGAGAQLKDCIALVAASQSRKSALQFCCTGTFNPDKKNSMGWIWHEGLNLYVDKSKCDSAELRKNHTERLESDKARKEYEAALSRAVGGNLGTPESKDYMAALNELEEKERKAKDAAERRRLREDRERLMQELAAERKARVVAERRRVEEERRARQAAERHRIKAQRLAREAAERRRIEEARREEQRRREMARRQAEINRRNQMQYIQQSINQSIRNLTDANKYKKRRSTQKRGRKKCFSGGGSKDCRGGFSYSLR
ncbi:MAG: hypothetical protein OXL41_00015 [Nitrospinae bacterium]|nr:hypothetical protein [Nitrospinota bacterium]